MAQKILLLDIDGVILKDKLLLHNVRENVVDYVQKRVPIKNLDIMQARHLNKLLYSSYGHTLRGMRIAFPEHAEQYTNVDFSHHVYNKKLLSNLLDYIDKSDEFKVIQTELQSVLNHCNDRNIPIHVLSNSPIEWSLPIFTSLDVSHMVISGDTIFHSDHPYFNNVLLKPDKKFYTTVYNRLKRKYSFRNSNGGTIEGTIENKEIDCVFVDDSPINLLPILSIAGWTPVLFKEPDYKTSQEAMSYIKNVSTLSEIKLYL